MSIKKNIACYSSILIIFCFVVAIATAHSKARKLNPEVAQLIREVKVTKEFREAGAVILLREVQIVVEQDGLRSATVHIVGKILDEKAASDYSQICIFFNSYYGEAQLEFAHTIKASGEITTVSKDAVQFKTPLSLTGEKSYTDIRILTFSLPALELGSVFEFQVNIKERPIIGKEFFESIPFSYVLHKIVPPYIPRVDPVYKSSLVINIYETENLNCHIYNAKIIPSIKKEGNYISYTWEMKNLPALTIEQNMPDLIELIPSIEITTLKDWRTIDAWANRLFSTKIMINEEIKAQARAIINEATTEQEKIESIYYYMQDKVEYIQADFNRGGYEPHASIEIFKNQYGDCKDQVILFITMLKAIGVTAYPVLIDPYPTSQAKKEMPSPYFSHVIAYIPNDEGGLWLDTTSDSEYPYLNWTNQGRWALVINGKGGTWLKTSSSEADYNQGILTFNFHFEEKTLQAEMLLAGRGAMSDNLKTIFKRLSSADQKDIIREIVKSIYADIHIKKVEFSNLGKPQDPFRAKVFFEFEELLNDSIESIPYSGNGFLITSLFSSLHNLPLPDQRKHDYVLGFKFKLVGEWICAPPTKEFIPKILPHDAFLDNPMVSFFTKYTQDGDIFRARSEFTLNKDRITKKEYNKFYLGIQDVMKKWKWEVLFVKKKIDEKGEKLEAEASASPQNAAKLLSLSKHYLTRGKYEEARDLLKKAATIEPKNGEVHYFMGIALSYLGEDSGAKKEFDKARELGYRPH